MNIVAISSPKGGVGKSTIALNLAVATAKSGLRVLLVDVDPQSALLLSLGRERDAVRGLVEVLAGRVSLADAVIQTRLFGLSVLPLGKLRMRDTSAYERHLEDGFALRAALAPAVDDFDVVLIDTPAGFGGATMGALRCADAVISPLAAGPLALRNAPEMLELIVWLNEQGHALTFLGFVLNMVNARSPQVTATIHEARERFGDGWLFETTIPLSEAFLTASAKGLPVQHVVQAQSAVDLAFQSLAREFVDKLATTFPEDEHHESPSNAH